MTDQTELERPEAGAKTDGKGARYDRRVSKEADRRFDDHLARQPKKQVARKK